MRSEWRVTWKRVGCRSKLKRFGSRLTAEKFTTLFGPEPWTHKGKGPDDLVCCAGRECGCGGQTYREKSEEQRSRQPGLEYVRLQARPYAPWIDLPSEVVDAALLSDFRGANQ